MGSLNGDIMVIRNGRSTSQVSVYNYPEHLNPFYEDDQHKRLRFWKINKKDNENRRNSFSIGNLKDMWAFKSFRTKKKSSTLGINKTSESPPLLRRDYAFDNGYNTFDHRLRANNTSSLHGDSFQRNATYRSSLQTLPTSNDRIGLNRNDGYRSTIQVPRSNQRYQPQQKQQLTMKVTENRRYVYGGSVTPQPSRNGRTITSQGPYDYDSENAIVRGSSQSSVTSTNPFEFDNDDEHEEMNSSGMKSMIHGSTTTLTSRTPRKKRRAPAPPTPINDRSNGGALPIIRIESSQDTTQDELHIKEDMDIANLSAEIQTFVKTKSNDDVEVEHKDKVQPPPQTTINISSNEEKVEITKKEVKTKIVKEAKTNSNPSIVAENIDSSQEANVNAATKANDHVATIAEAAANTTELEEKETNVKQISNEIENKINGVTPKKANSDAVASSLIGETQQQPSAAAVAELCINEINSEESMQKPVPFKRQIKPDMEVGQVECIHVHVESPKATPRKNQPNDLSSFKANRSVPEVPETISMKTPFVLTSPPTQKRNRQQTEEGESVIRETVKLVETNKAKIRTNDLNITEERISSPPEIAIKPKLSPKPVTKEINGGMHGFAEIHKPMRRNAQNGHLRRAYRDENVPPPTVRQLESPEDEKKINNTVQMNERKLKEFEPVDSLRIIETETSIDHNGNCKPLERNEAGQLKQSNCETSVARPLTKQNEVETADNEMDVLYRPKPSNYMEWKNSTLAPLETNIPPEKRKSVKDIIESINRSQRLLNAAANKDFTVLQNHNQAKHQSSINNNNNNLNENLKILDETEKQIEHLADVERSTEAANSPSPSPSNCNNECAEEIFQKFKVKKEVYDYRESSPISSNLDWNPVPKPKRTKPAHE